MQQYFENRTLIKFGAGLDEGKKYENVILANEKIDGKWKGADHIINNSTFANVGFLKTNFSNDDFRFNVFIGCYFKRARFENVNFNTSIFIDCNFDEATIINCTFEYCKFKDCFIKYDDLKASLPERPNIRWDLCKNLSLQCLALGHEGEYRKFYFAEKEASEEYYWKKFWHSGKEEEYYKKYNAIDKISGLWALLLSKINNMLWGYGEKLTRLIANIILTHILFTIGYYYMVKQVQDDQAMTWEIANAISLSNFFTVTCSYTACKSYAYNFLSVAEGGIGIVLMGFFVAALFRYINRRG